MDNANICIEKKVDVNLCIIESIIGMFFLLPYVQLDSLNH